MQISFVGNEKDFVDAQRAHAWRRYSPSRKRLQTILSPLVGLVFIAIGIGSFRKGWHLAFAVFEIVCGLYVALATSVLGPMLYRRAFRRRQTGEDHETILTFSTDAIECDCPGRSHSVLEWPTIKGMIENSTTMLLYISPVNFLMIPKRALRDEQLAELRVLLREKSVPASSPKVIKS